MIVCKPYWKLFVNFLEIAKLLVFIVGIGSYFSDYTTNQGWNKTSCWGIGVKKKKKTSNQIKEQWYDYTFKLQSMTTAGVWLDGKSSRIALLGEQFERQF